MTGRRAAAQGGRCVRERAGARGADAGFLDRGAQ